MYASAVLLGRLCPQSHLFAACLSLHSFPSPVPVRKHVLAFFGGSATQEDPLLEGGPVIAKLYSAALSKIPRGGGAQLPGLVIAQIMTGGGAHLNVGYNHCVRILYSSPHNHVSLMTPCMPQSQLKSGLVWVSPQ